MTAMFRVAVVLLAVLVGSSCQLARSDAPFFSFTSLQPAGTEEGLHDIVVWPVQADGTPLTPELCERMTKALHYGIRDQDYSPLSRSLVRNLAEQLGGGEAAARTAMEKLEAQGVLVLQLSRWDERALLSLGRVYTVGQLKLLGAGGKVLWQGQIGGQPVLLDDKTAPRDLEERRRVAVEGFAQLIAARLPRHRA